MAASQPQVVRRHPSWYDRQPQIEYEWSRWNFRKLYADTAAYNLENLGDGFGVIEEEGRLRNFFYFEGRHWDRIFYAIERSKWEEQAEMWRPYLQQGLAPDLPERR